ncbi:molybdenum cofactor cytidylyltransferase [Arcticibacter pallidicorallinus]|uniref:Molybdenum cofactor cytidylyltransferase n=1 Tax=Arcticibacter pallidicorallinus TaxID=1259464 RepID=A0A2T0U110_9SPHI|nr:nucleotidyltransferase family protein [Arcticibacter pallidicorallinus]PRY51583.1 molybdenum cofactor cytidylyltransferase [Arcticibacter pallidicorallinus]
MEDYAIIILAAGSSRRMGQPKQLLRIQGKTLLRHTIDEAKILLPSSVFVVVGANADVVNSELSHDPNIHICYNALWHEGMASSIKTGLTSALAHNAVIKGCLISVCDQPFLTREIYAGLIAAHKKNPGRIIASLYRDVAGVPVLFDSDYFQHLMTLNGQQGAKKLLNSPAFKTLHVPFPNGHIDLDTPEDYKRYLSQAAKKG